MKRRLRWTTALVGGVFALQVQPCTPEEIQTEVDSGVSLAVNDLLYEVTTGLTTDFLGLYED